MNRFELCKNFNIASTIINENIGVSTAAIFYNEWFGQRYQMETWVFMKGIKGSKMKIHNVFENQNGIDYCIKFHNKLVSLINHKLSLKKQ